MKDSTLPRELPRAARWLAAKSSRDGKEEWLPLWMHLADTAGVMELLASKWLPASTVSLLSKEIGHDDFRPLCIFLGASHDIGKATAAFESCIMDALPDIRSMLERVGLYVPPLTLFPNRGCSPHALAGEMILRMLNCPGGAAAIVGSHHGKPQSSTADEDIQLSPQGYAFNYYGSTAGESWQSVWTELISLALSLAGYKATDEIPQISMPAQVLLTGLLIMADWIASNTFYFPLIATTETGDPANYPARVNTAWERINLSLPWCPLSFSMDCEDFQTRFGFAPNAVQREMLKALCATDQPGIIILEAQMGVGKTEAALAAAEVLASRLQCGGVYMAMPTQATANGIFGRLKRWAETQSEETVHSIKLAHGMAELNEDYRALFCGSSAVQESADIDENMCGLTVHPWFEGRKQALLANFVVGTIDQLLMAALKQKHVMLRHLGLAGKVVIIDECHAYDAYMSCYLDMALRWLGAYGVPVIVLSATLPVKRRRQLVEAYLPPKVNTLGAWQESRAYPLLTWTDRTFVRQKKLEITGGRRTVLLQKITQSEIVERLRCYLSDGGCAGVVVNTVQRAQTFTGMLREQLPQFEVIDVHARFVMPDKAKTEKQLLSRIGKSAAPEQRDGLIVVGTQILEQSLDIDFDIMISDLCPMDLLLQRIGRLHRHPRKRPKKLTDARCMILGADDDGLEPGARAVYGEWLLLRTKALLPCSVALPEDIPQLVQDTYGDDDVGLPDEAYRRAKEAYALKQRKQLNNASVYRVSAPVYSSFPGRNTLCGWLETSVGANDVAAEAVVRDSAASIEVLVLVQKGTGEIEVLPWLHSGRPFTADHVPSEEECRTIARQRLRLPTVLGHKEIYSKVIECLEKNGVALSQWQQSHWLKGELFLLLDEELKAELCGYQLSYSRNDGLTYIKEGKDERH